MQMPSVGRIVHFKVADGVTRPAIIVHVWNRTCLNLQVFTDGDNDRAQFGPSGPDPVPATVWRTSVIEGEGVGQWCWPPFVPAS